MALGHGQDVLTRKELPLPIAADGSLLPQGVWDTGSLAWVKMTQPGGSGGGGGGPVTVADGADVTQGITTDAAVVTDANGTLSGKLRGLVKIFADVWDSANHRLKVDGSAVTQPVSGTFFQATQPVSAAALPLPAGASTSALQTTGNTNLLSIDGKVPALGQALAVAAVPVVLTAIQVVTLTPPAAITGFATETTLTARLAEATFTTRIPTVGQKALAASIPVVLASDQTAIPVTGGADHSLLFASDKADVSGSTVAVSASALPTGAATDANLTALIGTLAATPAAYTVLDRLYQIGVKLDKQASIFATETTMQKMLAALKPTTKPYTTLLHGR